MTIAAIQCPECKDAIFSRAQHDFHYCSCGYCFIDGGFDYIRYGAKDLSTIIHVDLDLPVTKEELYDDWNKSENKYGIIKQK